MEISKNYSESESPEKLPGKYQQKINSQAYCIRKYKPKIYNP